jgi:hypothetical protein
MSAILDYSKWLNHQALQPENLTALLITLGQGKFIAEDILPVVPSTDDFRWLTEDSNDGFLLAKKRGERGVAEHADLYDSVLMGSAYEYFVKSEITAKTLRSGNIHSFVNLLVRKTNMLANKIRLTSEKDMIDSLIDTTTYTTINVVTASVAWGTYATSDPYKYVQKAKNAIVLAEYIEADTMIMGQNDKTDMTLSDALRDSIQYTENYNERGELVERVGGLDLKTSTAAYKTISASGVVSTTQILSGSAIILKKGIIGELREAQPYDAYSDWDKSIKVLSLYASRVMKPIIIRPKGIAKLVIA